MNPKRVLTLQTATETALLLTVFALPMAYQLRMFDVELVKALTLLATATAASLFVALRWIELGRIEYPANRIELSLAAAALLGWTVFSFATASPQEPALFPAMQAAALVALFWIAFSQCASTSFAADLSDWAVVGALIGAATHLLQWSSRLAVVTPPEVSGSVLAFAFPIALSRMAEHERSASSRLAIALAAALCLAGVWTSPPVALVSLAAGCIVYAVFCMTFARDRWLRASGLAAAAALPVSLAATFALGGAEFQRSMLSAIATSRWDRIFEAAHGSSDWQSRALAAVVLGASALLAAVDAARRLKRDELRGGTLQLGHLSGAAALFVAAAAGVTGYPAPAALLWLFAGSMAGLALERGSARVTALAIAAPLGARRLLYAPALLGAAWLLVWPVRFHRADAVLNAAMLDLHEGRVVDAAARFSAVERWHKDAAFARYQAGLAIERVSPSEIELALAQYREAARLAPEQAAPLVRMSRLYTKNGDWKNAAESWQASLRIDPHLAKAYSELADALEILGRKDDAARTLHAWVRANPDDPAAWRALADHYRDLKKFRIARRMLEKAARVSDVARAHPADANVY